MRKNIRLSLAAGLFALVASQAPSFAYTKDAVNHVLTMSPSSVASTNTNELRSAVSFLLSRPDKSTPWTLKLNPGKYLMSQQVTLNGLQNTTIMSANLSSPAQLVKMPGWNSATAAEYLLAFQMCKNVKIIGLSFYGQTNYATNVDPYWPDQGVDFASCDTVTVDQNKFYNFGNSALRVSTWERDPVPGVHSFNTRVTNNLFNNIYQTSTTTQDNIHGGTAHYLMQNNTFVNLRGSVKFASRTPGATDIHVLNNTINGGDHFGLEINNYTNFEIRGNTIANIKSVAMNIYTGAGIAGFPWGDNFTIASNTFQNVYNALRFSHEPSSGGVQSVTHNLVIDSNVISGVYGTNSLAAINAINGTFSGVKITNNKLSSIANKRYISVQNGSTSVSILNNSVNGIAYGPQSTTASK